MDNKIKEIMKKIFTKRNTKIVIPAIVLLALFIIIFIFIKEYQYNNYRDKQDIKLYQYISEEKFEYEATISFNKDKVIKGFVPKEYKINYNAIPIYYADEKTDKVIFPNNMIVILPIKNESQYKIPEFTYVEKINNIQYLRFEDYHKNIDHYILFDGADIYFFSDSVTFTIGDEEITLSPLSYVDASSDEFKYYDYETDTYKVYNPTEDIIVSNDYYEINVTRNSLIFLGESGIIANNFDFLNTLN